MRRLGLAAALMISVVTAAGCATPTHPAPAGPVGPAFLEIQPAWVSCATAVPDPEARSVPDATELAPLGAAFPATAVVICGTDVQTRTDGGEEVVAVESRAENVDALLAALRLPDEPRTDGACTLELVISPWFALLDAQAGWVRPGVPTDACGKPRIEVREALGGLKLTRVSTRSLRELVSAEAAALDCGQQWSDMIWVETTGGASAPADRAVPFDRTQAVRLCRYVVPASERGSGKPAGEFDGGAILAPDAWGPIADAIKAAPKAAPCETQAGRFAVIRPTAGDGGTGGEVYVELDGCQRIMTMPYEGSPALVQADAALISQLTQAG